MNVRFFAALLTLAASVSLSTMHAQVNTSTISGSVVDESGSGVPNAKVVTTIIATGQQRDAVTNGVGEFVLPQLAPGSYRITVTAPGFQTGVVENLTLNIAERASISVVLKLGQVSEQVTIEASAPLLEQETASLGQVITRKAINDLPLNGRNYLTLGSLSPGVIPQLPASTGPSEFHRRDVSALGSKSSRRRPA